MRSAPRARRPRTPASTSAARRWNAAARTSARRSGQNPGVCAVRTTKAGCGPVRSAHAASSDGSRSDGRHPRPPAPSSVARRIEAEAVVASSTAPPGRRTPRRRRRSSRSVGRSAPTAGRCGGPRATAGQAPSTCVTEPRPRPPRASSPRSRQRGSARPAAPAASTASRTHARFGACSGNSPTCPVGVGRSSKPEVDVLDLPRDRDVAGRRPPAAVAAVAEVGARPPPDRVAARRPRPPAGRRSARRTVPAAGRHPRGSSYAVPMRVHDGRSETVRPVRGVPARGGCRDGPSATSSRNRRGIVVPALADDRLHARRAERRGLAVGRPAKRAAPGAY